MNRERLIRMAVVAGVVCLVAAALLLATRGGQEAPDGEPGRPAGGGVGADVPAPKSADRGPSGRAPGLIGGGPAVAGAPGAELPPGHPEVTPQPDESSMVSIQWIGHSEFYLQSPGEVVVVTDPFDPAVAGYRDSSARAHVVTVSGEGDDRSAVRYVRPFEEMGEKQVRLVREGTYRRGDVVITAIPNPPASHRGANGGNRLFLIEAGALRIAHLGCLDRPLTPAEAGGLGRVDVLLVPVGGGGCLGPSEAAEVVRQLNPSLVIPMRYRRPETRAALARTLRPVEEFTERFASVEFKTDYVALVARNTLPERTKICVLKPRAQMAGDG